MTSRWWTWGAGWAVVGLTVVAALLRLPLLGRSLWLDEAWLANLLFAPSWGTFSDHLQVRTEEGLRLLVPPLFAAALRCLALLVGRSEAGLRALPLAASVASVPLAYLVGRRVAGTGAGLVAAACFACLPAPVHYGQELKVYSTDELVVLILLFVVEVVTRRPEQGRRWLMLAVAASLAPGLSYAAALVLPGVALAVLANCRTWRQRALWAGVHSTALLMAFLWYVAVIGPQRDAGKMALTAFWVEGFPPPGLRALGPWTLGRLSDLAAYALASPGSLFLAAVLAGLLIAEHRLAIAALVTIALVVAAAAWRLYPLAADRTSLYLLPFLYLPYGSLVAALVAPRSWSPVLRALGLGVAAALLALPAGSSLSPQLGLVREETAPLVHRLAVERRPGDRLYVYHGAVPAYLFYGGQAGADPRTDPQTTLGGRHEGDESAYEVELKPTLVPGARLWLLFSHVIPARGGGSERDAILANLRLYGTEVAVQETPGASLYLLEVTRAPGTVRHLTLEPSDLADPERLRELLGRPRTAPTPPP